MKRWVIADTHFGHFNVIEYSQRPFKTVEEMDKILIQNWNNRVSKEDIVYMLGDFTLSRNLDYIKSIVEQLNGKIVLVMGNHDTRQPSKYVECGFHTAIRKPILVEPKVVLMHEPPLMENVVEGMVYIFGHVHEKIIDIEALNNCFCVSVERTNYFPINLDKILKSIKMGV